MDVCTYHLISNPVTQVHHPDHVNLQTTGQQKGIWGGRKMETETRYKLQYKNFRVEINTEMSYYSNTRKEWMKQDPEKLKRFIKGLQRGT